MNYILSYPSVTSRSLSKEIGIPRIVRRKRFRLDIALRDYQYRSGDVVLNWGSSLMTHIPPSAIVNKPSAVAKAVNKIQTFTTLFSNLVPTLSFQCNNNDAVELFNNHSRVYCRTIVSGTQGSGIVVASNPDELVPASLYTGGEDVKREYRVHIFLGECIDLTAKKLRQGETHNLVQNWDNGYIFVRNSVTIPDRLRVNLIDLAKRAIVALGLDFGAVDIIRNQDNRLKVLEVNSAPGLSGTTYEAYKRAITNLLV